MPLEDGEQYHKLIRHKFNLQLKASGLLKVVQQFPLEHKGPQY